MERDGFRLGSREIGCVPIDQILMSVNEISDIARLLDLVNECLATLFERNAPSRGIRMPFPVWGVQVAQVWLIETLRAAPALTTESEMANGSGSEIRCRAFKSSGADNVRPKEPRGGARSWDCPGSPRLTRAKPDEQG